MSYLINPFSPAINGIPPFNVYAPTFCCGGECGQIGSAGQHWSTNANVSISTAIKRTGTRSFRFNYAAAAGTIAPSFSNAIVYTDLVGRFYIYFVTLPSANTVLYRIANSSGSPTYYGVGFQSSTASIKTVSYSTLTATFSFGTSGVGVTTGQWYRVDWKIHDNGASTVLIDAKVNGTDCTQRSASTSANLVGIALGSSASVTGEWHVDDFLFGETLADYPFGPGHIDRFILVADGIHNIGTAFLVGSAGANITNSTTNSYLLVDDDPMDDTTPDTNDYINQPQDTGGGSNYVEHIFGPASGVSTPTSPPRAVEAIIACHQAATGSGSSSFKLNDGGTEDTIVALNAAGVTTTRYRRKHYANPPSGLGGWSLGGPGNFNDLRHRFGYSADGNPDQYFDCAMIEAEFPN